jgi:hypothetical protein
VTCQGQGWQTRADSRDAAERLGDSGREGDTVRKLIVSFATQSARVAPTAAARPSPPAPMLVSGRPIEYGGVVADLNARGYILDYMDVDHGVVIDWWDARTGAVSTYRVAHARVALDTTTGRLTISL